MAKRITPSKSSSMKSRGKKLLGQYKSGTGKYALNRMEPKSRSASVSRRTGGGGNSLKKSGGGSGGSGIKKWWGQRTRGEKNAMIAAGGFGAGMLTGHLLTRGGGSKRDQNIYNQSRVSYRYYNY